MLFFPFEVFYYQKTKNTTSWNETIVSHVICSMVAKITLLVVSTHVQSTENYTKETIQFYDTAKILLNFIDNIEKERVRLNLTQAQMAQKLDMSVSIIKN